MTALTLVTEDSIDDRIEVILKKKEAYSNAMLGDVKEDIFLPHLGKAELMYLLAKPEDAERLRAEINGA